MPDQVMAPASPPDSAPTTPPDSAPTTPPDSAPATPPDSAPNPAEETGPLGLPLVSMLPKYENETRVPYLTPEQLDPFAVVIEDGRLYTVHPDTGVLSPLNGSGYPLTAVLTPAGDLYVVSRDMITRTVDEFGNPGPAGGLPWNHNYHHSSITGGQPVAFAGQIATAYDGTVIFVNNSSGHYQPGPEYVEAFTAWLTEHGVPPTYSIETVYPPAATPNPVTPPAPITPPTPVTSPAPVTSSPASAD